LEQMWTPTRLSTGQPNSADYGFGWFSKQVGGRRVVEHSGAWQGFTCHISRFVDDHLTVAVLTNLAGCDPRTIAKHVAGLYVSEWKPER
jgi:hypothetical protein